MTQSRPVMVTVSRSDLLAVLEAASYAGDDCPPLHPEHPDWDGAIRRLEAEARGLSNDEWLASQGVDPG